MINCFVVLLWALSVLPILLIVLNIFQLEEYSLKKLYFWHIKNFNRVIKFYSILLFARLLILPLLFAINFYIKFVCIILFLVFSFTYSYIVYLKHFSLTKTPLKFTKRINRFILIFFILVVVGLNLIEMLVFANFIKYMFLFQVLWFVFFFFEAHLFSVVIEKIIFTFYKNQAIKKLRKMEDLIVVGITGSYGKTTVKNILHTILSEDFFVCKTPKSYNTPNGIVKSIRENLQKDHQIFICEMGANKNHDIKKLTKLMGDKLKIGIITSVGKQHLDGFKTIDNIYHTKFELAEAVRKNNGVMIFNISNFYVRKMFNEFDGNKIAVMLDGYNDGDDFDLPNMLKIENLVSGEILRATKDGSLFKMAFNGDNLGEFTSKLLGEHNVLNSIIASSAAMILGEDAEDIKIGLNKVKQVPNRLELKILKLGAILIDNGFNSNPISAEKALGALKYFDNYKKVVVTPGLIELSSEQFTENYILGGKIAKVADKAVILNEVNKKALTNGLLDAGFNKENIIYYKNFNDELVKFLNELDKSYVVLIENDLPSNYI